MVMNALRGGASGGITKFILFGFLILAVGGLVMTDVGGFFRGGVSGSDVAKVAGQNVPISVFDRTVRMTVNRIGMEPQEAYRVGYIDQILSGEIRARLLSKAAEDLNIVVGRPRIAKQISDLVAPLTQPGQNPADVLSQVLMNQGMTERMFVDNLGRDMANGLLATALEKSLTGSSTAMAKDLYKFQNEKRTVEYIALLDSDLKDLPAAKEEDLAAVYEATKEAHATPETRTFRLIKVKNDSLKNALEISDEAVRESYDSNIDLYTVSAQRTLDQALLDTEEQAKKVYDAAKGGKNLKSAVTDAGASPASYIGEQDFEDGTLMAEIKDEVLAAKSAGTVVGPVSTPLGWHVIVVKKINAAKTKSFDEVKTEIREEMKENHLVDQYYELANAVDDMFAGGSTIDDVRKEIDVDVTALDPVNQFGQGKDGKDALKAHEDIRNSILQTGFELGEGETSAMFETPGGEFIAVNVEKITPKSYTPFEDVKADLAKRWATDQRRVTNQVKAMQLLTEATSGGKTLQDIAKENGKQVQTLSAEAATEEAAAPLVQTSLPKIFETEIGAPVVIDIKGGIALARSTDFKWPEKVDEKSESFTTLEKNLAKTALEEAMVVYLDKKRQDYGATVNKALLDKVYGTEAASY